jgi:hypothetical protein
MDMVLKQYFDSRREKGELPSELQALGNVQFFDDLQLLKRWRSNRTGIRWEEEKGNVLMGAVDNILTLEGKLLVLDYKTRGFALKADTASHYKAQMDTYNLLLRKEGHETQDYSVLLFYHPKVGMEDGKVQFNVEPVKLPVDVDAAEDRFRRAISCLEGKKPKASSSCTYHNWKKAA